MGTGVALAVVAGAALFLLMRTSRPEAPSGPARALTTSDIGGNPVLVGRAPRFFPFSSPGTVNVNVNALEIAMGVERELTLEMERALVTHDRAAREAAFAFVLPELLHLRSGAVVAMIAAQAPGEMHDALRDETVRHWMVIDRDAAVEWMKTLPDADRAAAATVAMRRLAARSPAEAIRVADAFGAGRDDGSVDLIVRTWLLSEPEAARRWLAERPAGTLTSPPAGSP